MKFLFCDSHRTVSLANPPDRQSSTYCTAAATTISSNFGLLIMPNRRRGLYLLNDPKRRFHFFSNDIRSQLGEQLRLLEHQTDSHNSAALELSDFFKKRAEIENDYAHSLETLAKSAWQRIKTNTAKKDSLWNAHSMSDLLSDLVQDSKQQAKCHIHFSELCSKHIPEKISEACEDSKRMLTKCKQVAADCHEEIFKSLKEVQRSMKSYHQYQYASRQAEDKLTSVQQQVSKFKNKKLTPKYETRLKKRQTQYSDTKMKAFKARNDYILCIESSNTAFSHYCSNDISDLIDCMNFGFLTSVAKSILMYISAQSNVIRSRQNTVNTLNRSIADLDATKDKEKFLAHYSSLFSANKSIRFEAHKGDQVSLIHAQVLLKDEMYQRFSAIQNRLQTLTEQHEKIFVEIESIEQELMQLINVKNYDVTDLFKDLHFDLSCVKARRLELENTYIEKFRQYTLMSNLIARLKTKHGLLLKALGQSSASLSESRIVFKQSTKKIGKAPIIGRPRLFGGRLDDYIDATGQPIPQIIYSSIRAINSLGLHHQGIFRVSGSQVDINEFKEQFERGDDPLLSVSSRDMNSVAGVLKLYFRELKDPLFPREYFEDLMDIMAMSGSESQGVCRLAAKMKEIPSNIYVVMRYLFGFLNHLTEYSDENMMDANNIASCFAPTLIPVPEEYEQVKYLSNTIELIRLMVIHFDEILPTTLNVGPIYEKFPISSIDEEKEEYDDEDDDSNFDIDEEATSNDRSTNFQQSFSPSSRFDTNNNERINQTYHQNPAVQGRRLIKYKKQTRLCRLHRKSGSTSGELNLSSSSSAAAADQKRSAFTTSVSVDECRSTVSSSPGDALDLSFGGGTAAAVTNNNNKCSYCGHKLTRKPTKNYSSASDSTCTPFKVHAASVDDSDLFINFVDDDCCCCSPSASSKNNKLQQRIRQRTLDDDVDSSSSSFVIQLPSETENPPRSPHLRRLLLLNDRTHCFKRGEPSFDQCYLRPTSSTYRAHKPLSQRHQQQQFQEQQQPKSHHRSASPSFSTTTTTTTAAANTPPNQEKPGKSAELLRVRGRLSSSAKISNDMSEDALRVASRKSTDV